MLHLLRNSYLAQVFDEYDDEVAEAEAAEASGGVQKEDRDQDLKPFHHRARCGGLQRDVRVKLLALRGQQLSQVLPWSARCVWRIEY